MLKYPILLKILEIVNGINFRAIPNKFNLQSIENKLKQSIHYQQLSPENLLLS